MIPDIPIASFPWSAVAQWRLVQVTAQPVSIRSTPSTSWGKEVNPAHQVDALIIPVYGQSGMTQLPAGYAPRDPFSDQSYGMQSFHFGPHPEGHCLCLLFCTRHRER